jgi:hypothetical protein
LANQSRQNQLSEIGQVAQGAAQVVADNPGNAFGWVPGNESPATTANPYQTLYNAQNAGPIGTENDYSTSMIPTS